MAIYPWLARTVALVFLVALGLPMSVAPVLATVAPHGVLAESGLATRGGSDAYLAPLRQSADTGTDTPLEPDTDREPGWIAALTTILNQQGPRSVGNLERVSAIEVPNLTLSPEFVVDARVERAEATRLAAASASEVATVEAARSVQAAAEAQAEADVAVAAAIATEQADNEAETLAAQAAASAASAAESAALTATWEAEANAASATATADAQAAAIAIQKAEASAAAATAMAETQAADAAASKRMFSQRVTILLLSLAMLAGGFLGLRFWRNRKEPFVLKAIPASMTAQAHA